MRRHLARISAAVGLWLGERVLALGDRLWALPVATLWGD
jgi:hypothetical protein